MKKDVFNEIVVVKRSGQRVSFNGSKIALAIKKGFDSVYEHYDEKNVNKVYEDVLIFIKDNYSERKTINVEDIQDIIENILKKHNLNDVYASFNKYRERRAISREIYEEKREHKFIKSIEKLATSYNDYISDYPLNTLINLGKKITTEYSKSYILESKYVKAHEEGKIYIHNLEFYSLGIFNKVHLDISNIENFEILTNILLGSKKEQNGEISIPSFDYVLVSYILNEFKLVYKECLNSYLDLEGLSNYINIIKINEEINKIDSIKINLNYFEKYILNEKIKYIFEKAYKYSIKKINDILELKIRNLLNTLNKNECYINEKTFSISIGTNTTYEGTLINETLLKVVGKEKRLENVCIIYKLSKNMIDKNHDLIMKISNLISLNKNIALSNINSSYNKNQIKDYKHEVEYFSDGKRIFDNIYKDKKQSKGRMIVGSVSVNLVRLLLKNNNLQEFYKSLGEVLELAKNELLSKFEYAADRLKENFKYLFNTNTLIDENKLESGQRIRKIIKHGLLNIEILGLYECFYLLNKDVNKIYEITEYIRKKCDKYSEEFKLNFVLSETLNKNIKEELLSIDKSVYGVLPNITDKNYYYSFSEISNKLNLDDKLICESKMQKIMNGGYLININKKCKKEEVLNIINKMIELDIGFISFKKEMLL